MPQYVMLIKLTPQGAEQYASNLAPTVAALAEAMTELGGTMDPLITFGRYDIVASGSVPSAEDLAYFATQLAHGGFFTAETQVAFSLEEWDPIDLRPSKGKPFGK